MVIVDLTDVTQQRTNNSKYQSMDQSMNKLLKISVIKQLRIIASFADQISFVEFFVSAPSNADK